MNSFDDLLERYLAGKLTVEEEAKLDAWLETMKTTASGPLNMSEADQKRLYLKITSKDVSVEETVMFRPRAWHEKKWEGYQIVRIAAALLLLAAAFISVWYYGTREVELNQVRLADGTLIWLAPGGSVTYEARGDLRYATLQGEGLFEVAKDSLKPFVIACGTAEVMVKGTSFRLRSMEDELELDVLTGIVALRVAETNVDIEVLHGQQVRLVGGRLTNATPLNHAAVEELISKSTYNMAFDGETLATVAEALGRKFGISVTISDVEARGCRVTADLTDQSLASSLQVLTEVLDLHFEQTTSGVVLNGKGCR